MSAPDYSPFAQEYARARPRYPVELFAYLASLVDRRDLAWDAATGNGQAAHGLAAHFARVVATDVSAGQIGQAMPHPRIEYRVAESERSGIDDHSVDLVTVATAIHWFDRDAFFAEARRTLRPGGVLAAWSYHVGYVHPPFDRLFRRFYFDVLYPYFPAGARLVDDRYESLRLPGDTVDGPDWSIRVEWNLDQLLAFISSWSGTQKYLEARGENPVDRVADELRELWGERATVREVRWPLFTRIARLEAPRT
jgi:SAM-dependent methyltransferase